MKRFLRQCDVSAAESAACGEFTVRELVLLCATALLACGFLTFALSQGFSDPAADRRLLYFVLVVVGVFWAGALAFCYWGARWLAHSHNQHGMPAHGVASVDHGEIEADEITRPPSAG